MDGYLLALIIFVAWLIMLYVGKKFRIWEKLHCSIYGGIFLMVKTARGKSFLDKLAKYSRFWRLYSGFSIFLCIGLMLAAMILLIWELSIALTMPQGIAPSPETLLALPGINPVIPLWYGILGIAVAIIVHEFAHGIVSRLSKIKVESMGLLFLVVPMGAFVEPNETEISNTTSQKRSWIFAAGPATNLIVAFICLLLIILVFAPAAEPATPGVVVANITSGSPASHFGIPIWGEITGINNEPISDLSDFSRLYIENPGDSIDVELFYLGETTHKDVPGGIVIKSIVPGLPAYNAGIQPGMIIKSINGTTIHSSDELRSVIENETHQMSIGIEVLSYGYDSSRGENWFVQNTNITNITLISKWLYYFTNYPDSNKEEYRNISYMGITSDVIGISGTNPESLINMYAQPFAGVNSPDTFARSFLVFSSLPFIGYSPVEGAMASLYEPTGIAAALGDDIYWISLNSLYWIFWLNFWIGLFNALPIVPFDGGFVLRDSLKRFFKRLNKSPIGIEKLVGNKPITDQQIDKLANAITVVASIAFAVILIGQLVLLWI